MLSRLDGGGGPTGDVVGADHGMTGIPLGSGTSLGGGRRLEFGGGQEF